MKGKKKMEHQSQSGPQQGQLLRASTSFRLDPELLREARHFSIDHKVKLQDMVAEGLRLFMNREGGRK
jgi:hypothetical protein